MDLFIFFFGAKRSCGSEYELVIKIFKISTMEMWTLKDKKTLIDFIKMETNITAPTNLTINQLIKYLPIEDYHRVK